MKKKQSDRLNCLLAALVSQCVDEPCLVTWLTGTEKGTFQIAIQTDRIVVIDFMVAEFEMNNYRPERILDLVKTRVQMVMENQDGVPQM